MKIYVKNVEVKADEKTIEILKSRGEKISLILNKDLREQRKLEAVHFYEENEQISITYALEEKYERYFIYTRPNEKPSVNMGLKGFSQDLYVWKEFDGIMLSNI